MSHQLKTTLTLSIGGHEVELPAAIHHTRVKFYSGGSVSSDEPSHCNIDDVTVEMHGKSVSLMWLVDLMDADEVLQAELMEAWAADDAAAEEYRADAARDERLTRDWDARR